MPSEVRSVPQPCHVLTRFQIAASGLKPSTTQQTPSSGSNTQRSDLISTPQDGTHSVSHSSGFSAQAFTPKQKKLVALTPKEPIEANRGGSDGPQVHVHSAESASPPDAAFRALDGMLMPNVADESGTQMSSSSGSGKPPSVDGKSVTSGTTFALDEKESLRPDDSASVKATEDEDSYPSHGRGLPVSRTGSDDGVRAFRDQLREITSLEPSHSRSRPHVLGHGSHPQEGMLYIPPEGSGVGLLPGQTRLPVSTHDLPDLPPDPKLLEALDSPKDRIMVLKLEQDLVDFVKDATESSLTLPQTNAFYRMLAHKLADYYMLGHLSDETTSAVRIYKTPSCRLPPPLTGIATPSTAASTPPPIPPQMKILRRGVNFPGPTIANGSNAASKTGSENGESGNEERKPRLHASREEREAKYEEVRKRIMGSAKPSESPEAGSQKDDSRSSSAAGKKSGRKKQRADSDDDFEARSAYSAYYPQSFTPTGAAPTYGYQTPSDTQPGQYSTVPYSGQHVPQTYPPYAPNSGSAWIGSNYNGQQGTSAWMQTQQPPFDLSTSFQRAMTFQAGSMPPQNSSFQPSLGSTYNQQFNVQQQQQWTQQMPYMAGQPQQMPPDYMQSYPNTQHHAPGQYNPSQPYAYGQLPSQTFPGRPASKLEHPLPGSYKSKHFNPQSQSFVPGHSNGSNPRSFTPQNLPFAGDANGTAYNMPYTSPHRQQPVPAPNTSLGTSHPPSTSTGPSRNSSQPLVHPLPQPIFPRQPSPNIPLPPKPDNSTAAITSPNPKQSHSSIAKWATPASLPAKPPPTAETFDAAKFAQAQRQVSSGVGRGGLPSFGAMPAVATSYGVSGSSR
jgi:hypothetical protein